MTQTRIESFADLTEAERSILNRVRSGESPMEISHDRGVDASTVRTQLFRARQKVRGDEDD